MISLDSKHHSVIIIIVIINIEPVVYTSCVPQDPFVGISEKYKQPLSDDEHRLLTAFFSKSSADTLLLEMHEFLVLVLKKPNALDTYRPDWRYNTILIIILFVYLFACCPYTRFVKS